jgi:putative nucleotidyltransferase with HDIG domain
VITFVVGSKDMEMFYLIPYSLMAMYMMPFFRKSFVMVMYSITLLPLLIVSSANIDVFFIHLAAGFLGLHVYHKLNRGWLQFVGSFIVFLIMLAVWMGFALMYDNVGNWHLILYIALSAGLSIAGYPLIYLFERTFYLVSSAKLVELSDTSNALLRLLADKAPGTFHHSLQVMNIADAAARAINANVPLIRAAALYHDIGKITNPQCFTENEIPGIKAHDGLTPKQSAVVITRHVTDGLALAEKYKLPKVLRDFIASHHGTTSASYFLTKYLNDGGDPNDVKEFYYDGVKPATKEQVILMLSDAVEAASRSLKDYSSESISNLVDRIFDSKINEGQVTDADITLRQLNTIKEVMVKFLQQVYHSRIEYPKRQDTVKK